MKPPIEPVIACELSVNLKAGESQGLRVPEKVRGRAKRIIN